MCELLCVVVDYWIERFVIFVVEDRETPYRRYSATNITYMNLVSYSRLSSSTHDAAVAMDLEVKKLYLKHHVKELYGRADPATLWAAILKHRSVTDAASTEDMRIDYKGFRSVAYELIFGEQSRLGEAERQQIFFEHPFLSPEAFLQFEKDAGGTVAAVPLYAYAAKRLLLFRLRIELELFATVPPSLLTKEERAVGVVHRLVPSTTSPLSCGLTQDDLELFIAELVPNLRLVRDMPPWMLPYYLCHATRKFFFLCDPRGIGALSIDAIMKSDVFSELLRMYESDMQDATVAFPPGTVVEIPRSKVDGVLPEEGEEEELVPAVVVSYERSGDLLEDEYVLRVQVDTPQEQEVRLHRGSCYWCPQTSEGLTPELLALDNWFSLPLMHRVYSHFTQLDVDGDGVLTESELRCYSNSSYTRLAVHRVFECYISSSGDSSSAAMDYKSYLNFVVATEHPHTHAAARYLWRLLDVEETHSYVTLNALRCFTKEVSSMLVESGLVSATNHISSQSILAEVVDMINPAWHEHVTLRDVERCKQHATVLLILLNFKSFFAYDSREQSAAEATDEFVSQDTP